uniref:NACHT and WD repeat domain containing 1 n=1 Tax=Pundamilia nyererei TaxID=303518 RepID=A0A3B4G6G6_9CICH
VSVIGRSRFSSHRKCQLFCRSLPLQVVDLRWGIRNVPSGDHEACEVFLEEIQRCEQMSAGPTFVALLGNRYGHRALPRLIPEKLFDALLSKLSKNPEGIKTLNQWFKKDSNAVPPTYVLQPIITRLLRLLRSAATDAEDTGKITAEEKQRFYTSVTEREFERGLWQNDYESSALLFVREIPRQKSREGPKRFAKFMDVTGDGLLDAEAQGLLAGLKTRLFVKSQKILNLHSVELSRGSINPKCKEHAQYLDSVCEQFVSQMKARIEEKMDGLVVTEARRHIAISAELCRGFHGREGLLGKLCLAMWESSNVRHRPLVVHGGAGMGKTAVLCKLAQEMRGVLEARAVVVIRLLAACHPQKPDIDHVLHSICTQVCLASGLAPPSPLTVSTHLELLRFFWDVLEQVSQQGGALVIVLDSVEQLADQHHAHKLRWLPIDLPPNVHVVVSMETNSEAFANMRFKLESLGSFFEAERLSCEEGERIIESDLRASQRTLTCEQSSAVLQTVESSGCPLHLKLILSVAKRWTSFTPLTELRLGTSTQEMMSHLFLMLEEKHGKELVGGALGYITLAREGLLEAELCDVMSLDDDVISEVYRYSLPPIPSLIRLPPLLWVRLRRDLQDHLEERWTDGVATIAFNNKRLSEAVSAHYLRSERRGRSLRILAEYFLGRWSGKLRPASLPGLSLLLSDRKVPPQPLWFAPGLANIRKLQELPYHLLHSGLWEELRQEVISKTQHRWKGACGPRSLPLFSCSKYMDCTETGLIRDALVLMKPSLCFLEGHMEVSLFYSELLARLSSLNSAFPTVIGRLCSQCEEWLLKYPDPILIPRSSFLQQPGGALQHTLSVLRGGQMMRFCVVLRLLVAGSDDGVVEVWSMLDKQLVHTLLGHTGESGPEHTVAATYRTLENIRINIRMMSRPLRSMLVPPAGSVCERLPVSSEVSCLELAQNKRLLLCGLTSGTVLIYPLALPQETLCIPPPESLCRVLCLTAGTKEKHLAVAYEDSVCLFEITSRDNFPTVEGPLEKFALPLLHAPLSAMALLPDRRLLYGTSCGEVKLWDFSRGGDVSDLEPHRSGVTCVTVSNRGAHALVGSEDTVQRLWALNPLALDHTMEYKVRGQRNGVLSAAFSETDRFVFTGSQDRTIKVWDVASGNLLFVQYVYSPVVRMVTFRDGFVAITRQGAIIRELFRCPDHIGPDYNPVRSFRAQYRVTSREKDREGPQTSVSNLQDFNPTQLNLNLVGMFKAKPSSACVML